MKILECRGVRRAFEKGKKRIEVLRDVAFAVAPGEIALVTGKSGAGKSVLLWMLALLDAPTSGKIYLDGEDLSALSDERLAAVRRKKVRLIFQDFNLIESWTALENVRAAFAGAKVSRREQAARSRSLLQKIGLGDRLDNLPAELSIGQRQRVAVARSLVIPPRLIIADEPTGGLDPETGRLIIRLLVDYARKNSAGLVIATHGNFPLEVADRVFELRNCRLTEKRINNG